MYIKLKRCRSSDSSLKFENLKPESLVIVDQYATVNCFLLLYKPPVKLQKLVVLVGVYPFVLFSSLYACLQKNFHNDAALYANVLSMIEVKS